MATDREVPDSQTNLQRETLVVYNDRYRLGLLLAIVALGGVGVGFGLAAMAYRTRVPPLARVVPFDVSSRAAPPLLRPEVCGHHCGRPFAVRPWLGVQLLSVDEDGAVALELPDGVDAGAVVTRVFRGSPALGAGIEQGDVIVEVDGDAVDDARDVVRHIRHRRGGQQIDVVVVRDGERKLLKATLGRRAAND